MRMNVIDTASEYYKFDEGKVTELLNSYGLSCREDPREPKTNSFRKYNKVFDSFWYDISISGKYIDEIIISIFNTGHCTRVYEIFIPTSSTEGICRMGNTFEEFSKDCLEAIKEARGIGQ